MAVARSVIPHLKLVFGGTIGTPANEIWACSLNLVRGIAGAPDNFPTADQSEEDMDAISDADLATAAAGAVKTALSTFVTAYGNAPFVMDFIKLNVFDATDHQRAGNTVVANFAGVAGSFGAPIPWSTAVVLEHRTSTKSRGLATHGRISFPATGAISAQTGAWTTVGNNKTLAQMSADYATCLEALSGALGGAPLRPAILYTSTSAAKPASGATIDSVFASSIPGEVRSRQSQLKQGTARVAVVYAS